MVYKTSNAGIALIKKYEGCRLTAYKCPAGVWTIGYGHTVGVNEGDVISQAQAELMLLSDLQKYERAVLDTGITFGQNQFDALVSFAFNCGVGNLNKLVKGRTIRQIAEKIVLYNKAGGKVLPGLAKRRLEEQALFMTNCDVAKVSYIIGKNYILQSNMHVRDSAGGDIKRYLELTTNAKSHALKQKDGSAVLKAGTVVTVKDICEIEGVTWVKIPSGWVCAVGKNGIVYVK